MMLEAEKSSIKAAVGCFCRKIDLATRLQPSGGMHAPLDARPLAIMLLCSHRLGRQPDWHCTCPVRQTTVFATKPRKVRVYMLCLDALTLGEDRGRDITVLVLEVDSSDRNGALAGLGVTCLSRNDMLSPEALGPPVAERSAVWPATERRSAYTNSIFRRTGLCVRRCSGIHSHVGF